MCYGVAFLERAAALCRRRQCSATAVGMRHWATGLFTHQERKQCKNGALLCKKQNSLQSLQIRFPCSQIRLISWLLPGPGDGQVLSRSDIGFHLAPGPVLVHLPQATLLWDPKPSGGLHYTSNRGLGTAFPAAVQWEAAWCSPSFP